MKSIAACALSMLASTATMADSTLVTNPNLPYPPACATLPDPVAPGGIKSQAVKFYDHVFKFYDSQVGEEVPLKLRAYRAPCSEPHRSLIWLEFILGAKYSERELSIRLPSVVAELETHQRRYMSLASAPNGWGANGWVDREATYLTSTLQGLRWYYGTPEGQRRWVFLLDNGPPYPQEFSNFGLTPSEYNGAFKLVLRYNPYDFDSFEVPSTEQLLSPGARDMPLSGRLSGTWVFPEAKDQGIMLSISERIQTTPEIDEIRPDMPMVVFLAHYTYDSQGDLLWLTGSADFEPGETDVTIPIELVTNGEFRGSKRGNRSVIGSVTLRSHSCNDLGFEYDYSGLGLGTGQKQLQRLFSMEIAGHECRDLDARVAARQEITGSE